MKTKTKKQIYKDRSKAEIAKSIELVKKGIYKF